MGLFASPNRAGVMNSLPPRQRGAGAGMNATFQTLAMVLSIGLFFSPDCGPVLRPARQSSARPAVPWSAGGSAIRIADLPPVSSLFAAFLGYNPIKQLLGPLLPHLAGPQAAVLTGQASSRTS